MVSWPEQYSTLKIWLIGSMDLVKAERDYKIGLMLQVDHHLSKRG